MRYERLIQKDIVRDGRRWGDVKPKKVVKYTKDGKKYRKVTQDSWECGGSYDPDQEHYCYEGQYARITCTYEVVTVPPSTERNRR